VVSEADHREEGRRAFRLAGRPRIRIRSTTYDALGYSALLIDYRRRWLRWHSRLERVPILLSWGDYLAPGTFNDDPLRNSKRLGDLLPDLPLHDLEAAGAVTSDDEEPVGAAPLRLSRPIDRSSADRLSGRPVE
jgi:hypothetical protein